MPKYNEIVETCLAELQRFGVQGTVNPRSKHLEISWAYDGKQRSVIVSASPSDHRASLNQRAHLRRILRADGKVPVEPEKVTSYRNVIAQPKPVYENDRQKLARLEQEVAVLSDMFFDLYEQVQNARATVEVSFDAPQQQAAKPSKIKPSRILLAELHPTEFKQAGALIRAHGLNPHSAYNMLLYLSKQGLVEKHGVRGVGWRLTPKGVEKRNALKLDVADGPNTPNASTA